MRLDTSTRQSLPGGLRLITPLLVGALLVLAPFAARANAAPGDFPSPLSLSATTSGVVTAGGSRKLLTTAGIGGGLAAPTGAAVAGSGMGSFAGWRYVYTLSDTPGVETAPSPQSNSITTNATNGKVQLTLPAGLPAGSDVRIYRKRSQTFFFVAQIPSSQTTYTDAAADPPSATLMPQAQSRVGYSTAGCSVFPCVCDTINCGYSEFWPSTPVANFAAPVPAADTSSPNLTPTASTTPNNRGWLFDVAGPVSFTAGTWTFRVQTKSGVQGNGTARLVVGLWKVKVSGGAIDAANSTLLIDPNTVGEQTSTNLINTTNNVQTVTHNVTLPVVTLGANEYLYVQFWRHQTSPYTTSGSNESRTVTLYENDGVGAILHPADDYTPPNPFSVTAPASGAFVKNGQTLQSNPSDPTPDLVSVAYYYCQPLADCSFAANRTPIGSSSSSPYSVDWTGQPADGAYQLLAVATDNVGNTAETPVVAPINVDNTAPDTSLTSTPSDPSNASASFDFSSPDPGTFQCSLDGAPFAPCTSPQAYTGLASGSHTFQARAVDQAGNVDATPASLTWTVDATAPTVSFSTMPSNPSASASASFSFGADESATFECRLDGGTFSPCATPRNLSSLPDGSHTFDVRATDGVGNVGTAAYTWTVDTITPVVTFTSTPPAVSGSSSASFSFNVSESGTIECSLDGAAYAACSSPHSLTGLAEGSHTFDVRATDAVGHVGTATYTWTVDTITPTVTFTSTPPSTSSSMAASFSFAVSEPATIQCGLDGGAFVACTSPRNLTNLADGSHTFEVRATDGAGNVGSATNTWTVDTSTPVVTFNSTPSSLTNTASATFSFSANEPATLECRLDGAAYAACSSPSTVSLGEGTHTFEVRATDAAGHAGTASFNWTVDTVAPSAPALDQPFAGVPTRSLRLTAVYTGPEQGSRGYVEFRVCTDAACANVVARGPSAQVAKGDTASWTIDVALADGTYFWQARSVDIAGNASDWAKISNFVRDTVSPAAPGGFVGVVAGDGLTLRWTAPPGGEQIGNYVVYVNGKQWRVLGGVTYEVKVGSFDAGDTRSFTVSAVDSAGNEGPQTTPLVGVPDVIGLTVPAAKDAIETRGLVLDELRTVHADGAPSFVVAQTPPAPALAAKGSAVDVVVGTAPTNDSRPLVKIDRGRVCGTRGNLTLQLRLLERANVTLSVFNARNKRLVTKRLGVRPPGLTNHHLKLKVLGRPGRYRLLVTAKASARSGRDALMLTVRRAKPRGARTGC